MVLIFLSYMCFNFKFQKYASLLDFSITSNPDEGLVDENLVSVYKIFVIFCRKTFCLFSTLHINVTLICYVIHEYYGGNSRQGRTIKFSYLFYKFIPETG